MELFDNVDIDINELLRLDVSRLRDEIIRGTYTCKQVVTVFA